MPYGIMPDYTNKDIRNLNSPTFVYNAKNKLDRVSLSVPKHFDSGHILDVELPIIKMVNGKPKQVYNIDYTMIQDFTW